MSTWEQKRRHMHHYNHTANIYNTRYAEEQSLKIEAAIDGLNLSEGFVIDLGCGTGLLLKKIQGVAKDIVCLDVSKNMLKQIEMRMKYTFNVHLILADADYSPFKQDCFDICFAITLLQNMPSPHRTLQEIKRITKPDATIIITGLKKHFTQQGFLQLLKSTALDTVQLKTDDKLKCYVGICAKHN